jgi:hypothetical protein
MVRDLTFGQHQIVSAVAKQNQQYQRLKFLPRNPVESGISLGISQNARGKTLIIQSSSPAVPDTLADNSQAQRLQNQLVYTKVVCPLSFYRSSLLLDSRVVAWEDVVY